MFGKQAFDLAQEVFSCPKDVIPPFNDDAFNNVVDEINVQYERLVTLFHTSRQRFLESQSQSQASVSGAEDDNPDAWRGTPAEATEMIVHHASILRNKRLLFAYIKERIERLQELRWTQRSLPEHVENNLAVLEIKYFRGYDQLLNRYMRSGRLGVGLDLTADPEPPEDPFAQVRVLRDFGEVVFSSGKISLQRGKSHWLPRDEAHPLVMDGVLEFVPGARG